MKTNLKRKYYLDERKITRAKSVLGAKTETESNDAALDLIILSKEILDSVD